MKNNQSFPKICKLPKAKSSDQSWLTLHNQFTIYGRNAKEWMRKCALLLPQIEKQQIWRKKRFKDIYEYSAKLAGMNHDQVNEALRVLRKAETFPSLMKVIEAKGINSVKPVLSIITKETENLFAEKAMEMSNHTLRAYVKGINQGLLIPNFRDVTSAQSVNLQSLSFESQSTTEPSQKITIAMHLDPQTADQLQKLKGQGDWNGLMKEFLKFKREKLEENKPEVVEVRDSKTTGSRAIPAAIKRHVLAKTNSTCSFPSCTKTYTILHHTDRFAIFHTHDPDHIIPLCEAHERLAHLGLIENENQSPENWKIRARADYDDPKYEIDRVVGKFRQTKR